MDRQAVYQLGDCGARSQGDFLRPGTSGRSGGREVADSHLNSGGFVGHLRHRLATDRAHRAVGLNEIGGVDAVAGGFAPHRGTPCRLDRVVVSTAAQ